MDVSSTPPLTTWRGAILAYLTHLQASGLSQGTVRLHAHYLRHLRAYAPAPGVMDRQRLNQALAIEGWAPETRKSARAVAVKFFTWAEREGVIPESPAHELAPVRVPPGVPHPIPDTVLYAALSAAPARERLMMEFAAFAGLRCAEIATIHAERFDGAGLYVVGKGGKARYVPITRDSLTEALRRADSWLFEGGTDGHLSPGHVSVLIGRCLPSPWTAHTLRHRFASVAYANGADLLALGRVLGHSKPETTQRYTAVPAENLRGVVLAASA